MVKKITLIVFLVTSAVAVKSQQYLISLKEQGNKMANAAVTSDYKTLLRFTHPAVIKMMGGAEKAQQVIAKGMNAAKASGVSFEKAGVGAPQQLIVGKTNIQCLMPQTVEMKMGYNKIESVTHLFCITYNSGKDWYFVDVGRGNEAQVRKLLPEMSAKLVVPKTATKAN